MFLCDFLIHFPKGISILFIISNIFNLLNALKWNSKPLIHSCRFLMINNKGYICVCVCAGVGERHGVREKERESERTCAYVFAWLLLSKWLSVVCRVYAGIQYCNHIQSHHLISKIWDHNILSPYIDTISRKVILVRMRM